MLSTSLGTTSLMTDANGNIVSELRDKPCPLRYTSGVHRKDKTLYTSDMTYTPYQFTTQRNETCLGLYFYNACWLRSVPVTKWRGYDPSLGRFTQADTIVPTQTQGVQAWDRFAYANNSPILFTDPSGHGVDC